MKVDDKFLLALGAFEVGGRYVLEQVRFRLTFIPASGVTGAVWDTEVLPLPARGLGRWFTIATVGDLLHALFWSGHTTGEEDLREKFRRLMGVAGDE